MPRNLFPQGTLEEYRPRDMMHRPPGIWEGTNPQRSKDLGQIRTPGTGLSQLESLKRPEYKAPEQLPAWKKALVAGLATLSGDARTAYSLTDQAFNEPRRRAEADYAAQVSGFERERSYLQGVADDQADRTHRGNVLGVSRDRLGLDREEAANTQEYREGQLELGSGRLEETQRHNEAMENRPFTVGSGQGVMGRDGEWLREPPPPQERPERAPTKIDLAIEAAGGDPVKALGLLDGPKNTGIAPKDAAGVKRWQTEETRRVRGHYEGLISQPFASPQMKEKLAADMLQALNQVEKSATEQMSAFGGAGGGQAPAAPTDYDMEYDPATGSFR